MTLKQIEGNMQKEHVVQSIILLWMFYKQNDVDNHKSLLDKLKRILMENIKKLNITELSTCYLCLRKMDEDNSQPLMRDLLMTALKEVESSEEIISLTALSRLVVGINTGRNFFTPMLCANFIKHLDHHIVECSSENDARLIAICILNLQPLICNEMMTMFKEKVQYLLKSGEISASNPKTILKILNMLNMSVWSNQHVDLIRNLLLALKPAIKELEIKDLKSASRIYQYHMEPASIHEPLSEALEELLATHMSPETLACYVPFSQPNKRDTLINAFKALLSCDDSWEQSNASGFLFSILRGLKISESKICNTYWNGILHKLEQLDSEVQTTFLRHCHRYMNFNNNLGGTYRHIELEKKLSQLCMRAIEHDVSGRIPYKFARLASFVLAYGHTPYSWKKYPNILLSEVITMADLFTPNDCFLLSRGIRTSLEMR